MSAPIDKLLFRLDKVRSNGNGKYMACCPAHDDRSPSLSIKETDTGRVLVHCFAGCLAADVMAAVGLTLADLYLDSGREVSAAMPAWRRQRLEQAIDDESLVLRVARADLEAGLELGPDDIECVERARSQIKVMRGLLS